MPDPALHQSLHLTGVWFQPQWPAPGRRGSGGQRQPKWPAVRALRKAQTAQRSGAPLPYIRPVSSRMMMMTTIRPSPPLGP